MGDRAPLNDVDRWFEHAARTAAPPASLYASLLTGRISGYIAYRLRYPFLLATLRFAVHVAEFFILLSSLGGVAAFTVMVLRAGSLIVAGGWWGLLEVMRERLRQFARAREPGAADREIGRWLVLGAILAVLVTVAGGIVLLALSPAGDDPVARLYAFLIVVELAIEFPVRVLHSGIYATRRVYKPVWSMFLPTVVQLAILGVGFLLYPAVAIVVAIIAVNALSIAITVRYTVEVYRLTGLHPRLGPGPRLPVIPPRLGFETTVSGLSLRLDAVLVLALVGFYGTNTRTFDLTAGMTNWQHIDAFQFFYLILPLFRGTYESAAIFYFDLVRLRGFPAIRRLSLLFFHRLLWAAPVIALFFWALAAGLGVLVLRDVPMSFLLALVPMFVVRSLIGIYQIRLFADGRFGTHIATLVLLIVLLGLVWMNPDPAGDLIQITAAMITQLIVLMNVQHLRDRRDPPLPTLLDLGSWTRALARENPPVALGELTIPDTVTARQRSAVVALARESFSGGGHCAFRTPRQLVYYQRGARDDSAHLTLQEQTGCTAHRGIGTVSGRVPGRPPGPETLRSEFEVLFGDGLLGDGILGDGLLGDGVVFDAETLDGAERMRSLDRTVLSTGLQALAAAPEEGRALLTVAGRRITPIYSGGTLHLIFVLPTDPPADAVRRWLDVVAAWQGSAPVPRAPGHVRTG